MGGNLGGFFNGLYMAQFETDGANVAIAFGGYA